jgi:hypothetical protein
VNCRAARVEETDAMNDAITAWLRTFHPDIAQSDGSDERIDAATWAAINQLTGEV